MGDKLEKFVSKIKDTEIIVNCAYRNKVDLKEFKGKVASFFPKEYIVLNIPGGYKKIPFAGDNFGIHSIYAFDTQIFENKETILFYNRNVEILEVEKEELAKEGKYLF